MSTLRYLTAGESHGKGLSALMEGIPANLELTAEYINNELARRQMGYGRGGRMKIETDTAEILSGIRFGRTLGSPIALFIENRDWENWQEVMSSPPLNPPFNKKGGRGSCHPPPPRPCRPFWRNQVQPKGHQEHIREVECAGDGCKGSSRFCCKKTS